MAHHLRDRVIMTAARTSKYNKIRRLPPKAGDLTGQILRLAGQALPGARVGTSNVEPV